MKPKFIILGDPHLGKGLNIGRPAHGGLLNSRIQDQLDLLDWTLQQAIFHGADNIIITGDVYEEPRPHPALISYFMSWLKKCERSNVFVHIIAGNHDIVKSGNYTVSALDLVPAVELPHATTHKIVSTLHCSGISITFLPYRDRRMFDASSPEEALKLLKSEFESEPGTIPPGNLKVLIGHLAIEGSLFIGDEVDDMLNEIFCPTSIFADYDYIWMGHIHKPQVLSETPYVAHVGSMDRSDFSKSELDHDKILILIDPSQPAPFRQITVPTRPLRKVVIDVPPDIDTTDFVINRLDDLDRSDTFEESIIRIEIQLTGQEPSNCDRNKVNAFLQLKKVHHVCGFSESRILQPVKMPDQDLFNNKMNIVSAINAWSDNLQVDEKNDVKQFLLDCYQEYKSA